MLFSSLRTPFFDRYSDDYLRNGMVEIATEYGVLMSLDTDLTTLLYFISAAKQKRLNREKQQQ
jgi:hypothetical protein